MNGEKIVPEGFGFELDYDRYALKEGRKFESADVWWNNFSTLFENKWGECNQKDELLRVAGGDKNLAMVVFGFAGENSLSWFTNKRLEDLGWLTPIECVQTPYGIKRLRMLLMSAHY